MRERICPLPAIQALDACDPGADLGVLVEGKLLEGVEGMSMEDAHALNWEAMRQGMREECCYVHRWEEGDLLICASRHRLCPTALADTLICRLDEAFHSVIHAVLT